VLVLKLSNLTLRGYVSVESSLFCKLIQVWYPSVHKNRNVFKPHTRLRLSLPNRPCPRLLWPRRTPRNLLLLATRVHSEPLPTHRNRLRSRHKHHLPARATHRPHKMQQRKHARTDRRLDPHTFIRRHRFWGPELVGLPYSFLHRRRSGGN